MVTLSWWQSLDVGNRILILMATLKCWFPTFKKTWCSWQKWSNPSKTCCHQKNSSPTSVTNIHVTNWHIFLKINKNCTDLFQILGMSFFQSMRDLCHSDDDLSKSFQAYKVWYTWFSYGNIILQVQKKWKSTNLTKRKSKKSSILHQ